MTFHTVSFLLISLIKVEKVKMDAEDGVSHDSEGKSDSLGQSSTPGVDSDHDYTVIGSSSPTHTEDRQVKYPYKVSLKYSCIYPDI